MNRGLHLLSCYLPADPFVDAFLSELSAELDALGQRLVLLTTYEPRDTDLPFVRVSYGLDGFRRLFPQATGYASGLLPEGMADAEALWTRHRFGTADYRAGVAACAGFFGTMLDELEPDSVTVWNPTVPQGRLLQAASLTRGLPFFGVERGVFAETLMLESLEVSALSDIAANPIVRSLLATCPADEARLDAIRAHYAARDGSRYEAAAPTAGAEARAALDLPADAPVFVLLLSASAANWLPRTLAGARFASPWFASAEETVRAMLDALPADARLVVQAHPIDRGHWTAPEDPRLRVVDGLHLRTLFELGDALAFLGATTVQHEALLHDKPVLLLSRSQLTGQGVAYQYDGADLAGHLRRALDHVDRDAQRRERARYVPALFEHVLYGREGSPARLRPADLARHYAGLEAAHDREVGARVERWLEVAGL